MSAAKHGGQQQARNPSFPSPSRNLPGPACLMHSCPSGATFWHLGVSFSRTPSWCLKGKFKHGKYSYFSIGDTAWCRSRNCSTLLPTIMEADTRILESSVKCQQLTTLHFQLHFGFPLFPAGVYGGGASSARAPARA